MKFGRWLIAGLTLICSACSDGGLPDAYRLESFRVLALIADRPEAAIGDTVTVTPLLSDINGAGRSLTFDAVVCGDPGVGLGADASCDGAADRIDLLVAAPITGLSAPNYTGSATSTISFTIPNLPSLAAGGNYLLTAKFYLPDGSSITSFKRIQVSGNAAKNSNPVFAAPPLTTLPKETIELRAELTEASKEVFDGETEILKTSWFISDGELSITLTDHDDPTRFTPPTTPPTQHGTVIVAVTRDGRGGTAAFVGEF